MVAATAASVAASHMLAGKTFLVTGASSGIGLECAKQLYVNRANVVLACRKGEKAESATASIRAAAGSIPDLGQLLNVDLDLGDPLSVKACAASFLALKLPLHALINNAGINGVPKWGQYTPNIESQFAVNFLGHCLLASLLHDALSSTPGSRLVVVSSESHRRVSSFSDVDLPPPKSSYDSLHAYAFSNLCRLLWAKHLSRTSPYPVLVLHPGVVGGTGMMRHMSFLNVLRQLHLVMKWERKSALAGQTIGEAAATQTWAAVADLQDVSSASGKYLNGNKGRAEFPSVDDESLLAKDEVLIEKVAAFAKRWVDEQQQQP